ncbi:MAG: hypothetical protein ACI9NT_000849 [Bacteroidia bacterium]|jgi:hypothetical protein
MHRNYARKAVTKSSHTSIGRILACAMLLLALPLSAEEAKDAAMEDERCISSTRIDNTEILDDRTIVFHMLGKGIYLNKLPHRCPSMRRHSTIAYKTQTSQLCRVDSITLLQTAGGLSRGPTCGLGMFTPITKDELKALKNPEPKSEEETDSAHE